MNADDPRSTEMAEVAQLVPAPAERELPAGRQHTLKEHLMSELRLATSPPAGRPPPRRRKPAIALAAPGAPALAAALVLTLLPRNTPGSSPAPDPHALLHLIGREMQGQQPGPQEAVTTIGDLLHEAIAPPQVSAALYRAAALIPGVTVVADATDAVGRHGVAVAMTSQGMRSEWIFSRQTLQYLGERDINIANGATTGEAAVLQRAFVNHIGQVPG